MRLFVSTGDVSGDKHVSKVIKELRVLVKELDVYGIGGDELIKEGARIYCHLDELSVVGVSEIFERLPAILKAKRGAREILRDLPPDIVLLVDYPGFNLPLARDAHNMGLKVVYYIPPQVWAWAPRRLRYLKLYVDEVISILPFEKAFYKRYGIKVNFVGHPLLDEVDTEREDERYIALLPGSRMSEIRQILPLLLSIADSFPDEKFVVSLSSPKHEDYVTPLLKGKNSRIEIDTGSTIEVLSRSKLAVAASGTVTLECAIMGVAMVIVYKVSPLTWLIGRALVKVPHIGLVNLVAGRRVVPEFLQGDATRDRIVPVIKSILGNRDEEMKRELCRVKELLGERGASRRAAEIIAKLK